MSEPLHHEGYPPEDRPEWLASNLEEAIDPEKPIIDCHFHLLDMGGTARYMFEELAGDLECGHDVEGLIFIEALMGYLESGPEEFKSSGEAGWIADHVESGNPTAKKLSGMLGIADISAGESVGAVLDAHITNGRGYFKGVRDRAQWSKDEGFRRAGTFGMIGTDAYAAGSRQLAQRRLVHDLWIYHEQISDYTDLVRKVPEGQFVIDHLGGMLGLGIYEGHRDEVVAAWRKDIAEFAALPNTAIKLSGIAMRIFGLGFETRAKPASSDEVVAEWGDIVKYALDTFGPERCMVGSNFPLDRGGIPYGTMWNSHKKMTNHLSASEQAGVLHDNAVRIYNLKS